VPISGFEQAANSVVRRQRNNRKTRKWTTHKREQIRLKYSATVALSMQEEKDGTNKHQLLYPVAYPGAGAIAPPTGPKKRKKEEKRAPIRFVSSGTGV